MKNRLLPRNVFTLFMGLFCSVICSVAWAKTFDVALLIDGESEQFEEIEQLFKDELTQLTDGEFTVRFPEDLRRSGDWQLDKIKDNYQAAENDSRADIILTIGTVSSLVAARDDNHRKPTFAPMILDGALFDLPRQGDTSGQRNLNYLSVDVNTGENIETFYRVVPFKKVGLMVDQTLFDSLSELAERGQQFAGDLGFEIVYITQQTAGQDMLAAIPADVEAVMVAPLPRMTTAQQDEFIQGLIQRKIPSFSLEGENMVRRGLLSTTSRATDFARLARKNALNIQAVMLGESASSQSVVFTEKKRLVINMATARAIDVSPSFAVLTDAQQLFAQETNTNAVWSLNDVAKRAAKANLQLQASAYALQSSATGVDSSASRYRPQINAGLNVNQLDGDSPSVVANQVAERSTSASIQLNQLIYSEQENLEHAVVELGHQSAVAAHQQRRLDVIESATVAFLNVLKAQTALKIRQDNLALTRTNLELARDRVRLGSVTASDEYRWISEFANAQSILLSAQSDLGNAMDNLNILLNEPVGSRFATTPSQLNDPALLFSDESLISTISNRVAVDRLTALYTQEAVEKSPELTQLKKQIEVAERQLQAGHRAYTAPTVSFTAQLDNTLDNSPDLASQNEGDTNWQVGLQVSIPLYLGGRRSKEITRIGFDISDLQYQHKATQQLVEQRVKQAMTNISASYPTIRLSQDAADAAQRNLELVADNYQKGTVSVLDFLDARDNALSSAQSANDAVYDFLIDVMMMQRATTSFDFFLNDVQRAQRVEKIKAFVNGNDE